jgi:hypothetical protein
LKTERFAMAVLDAQSEDLLIGAPIGSGLA